MQGIKKIPEDLWGSLLTFTRIFYELRTGREFKLSYPDGRESHYITICRELMKVFKGETNRLIINIAPRYGKTELLIHFIAWALSQYPDSNFLYVSYSLGLAKKQTKTIRQIINMPEYKDVFKVEISEDTSAQHNFETTKGGTVYAAGAEGEITGRGAGIQNCDRFGGAIIIDDIHKPTEVHSDTVRSAVNEWYYHTLLSRLNSPSKTPIIFIGQRLHEDDLAANLIKEGGWKILSLSSLDENENALNPNMHSREQLLEMKRLHPYVFAAQHQQDPLPAGGGVFKPEWFVLHDEEPEILTSFITVDTAETAKTYNDPTVFSHFGVYKIKYRDIDIEKYAIHWIDCIQTWIEPKDLEGEFLAFYARAMRHRCPPVLAAIEKKSTGVTLSSVLKKMQGITIIDIERSIQSKTDRFLEIQHIVSEGLVSLPTYGKHTTMCINHCKSITANNSHRHDDIADTMYDGIRCGIIDKLAINYNRSKKSYNNEVAKTIMGNFIRLQNIKQNRSF